VGRYLEWYGARGEKQRGGLAHQPQWLDPGLAWRVREEVNRPAGYSVDRGADRHLKNTYSNFISFGHSHFHHHHHHGHVASLRVTPTSPYPYTHRET
jgi:hypothetical protein